uniref:Odorant receptor n=1 Tax=Anopheles farauti TaxID=69004 RepID=A0A182QY64_9DIPT
MNLLANPLRCVKDFGIWRGILVQLWRVMCIIPLVSYVSATYWNIQQRENILECFFAFSVVFGFMFSIVRGWLLNMYERELDELRAFFNDRSYEQQNEWVHRQRSRFYRRWCWIMSVCMLLVATNLGIFMGTNWNKPIFNLQYRGVIVRSVPVKIVFKFFSGNISFAFLLTSGTMYLVLKLFRMEFTILTRTLKTSLDEKTFSTFTEIFRLLALLQYHGTLILTSCLCLYCLYQQFSLDVVIFVPFCVYLLCDTLLISISIDDLNDLNQDIGYIVYSLYWPATIDLAHRGLPKHQLKSVRRTILIVMQHSQQPLRFGYGEFGSLSRQRFADMVQNIYSLLTFMWQFK